MLISQVRVDLIDLYTTIDPLRGLPKNSNAPFSFLTAKWQYNGTYGRAVQAPVRITAPPFDFQVGPICREGRNQNFWNGARNRRYDGYVGSRPFREVAWDKFLPFLVEVPLTITPTTSNIGTAWTSVIPRICCWSCGWGLDLRLTAQGALSLQDLASLIFGLRTQAFALQIGQEAVEGPITTLLGGIAQWVQQHILQPVVAPLSSPIPAPERYGPFMLIAVQQGSDGPHAVAQLDEDSQRLIYAATSQNPAWKSYGIEKIREGFKDIDTYPGSFIFMDRMARFFWFPSLMTTHDRLDVKLDCYVENTKAATMMMARLAEFMRLLIQRQTATTLQANYPLRDLFEHALTNLEQFQSFYRNTNVKRLTMDLSVARFLKEGKALLS